MEFVLQVDREIGRDHLFKKSIILVKAWCFYESRLLGAHHGLISTYALETLVLYIFHVFPSSLRGPLKVSSFMILNTDLQSCIDDLFIKDCACENCFRSVPGICIQIAI
jgi:hypothetical protein